MHLYVLVLNLYMTFAYVQHFNTENTEYNTSHITNHPTKKNCTLKSEGTKTVCKHSHKLELVINASKMQIYFLHSIYMQKTLCPLVSDFFNYFDNSPLSTIYILINSHITNVLPPLL